MGNEGAVSKLPKPAMRGMMVSLIKRNMAVAFSVATVAAGSYWYFVARQRKLNYENFYKNYDAMKDYERMKAAGVFQSTAVIENNK